MSSPLLLGPRRLRALLDRHGVTPTKSLGQNFVVDPNTIRKVLAAASVGPRDRVLEIGAGAGSLTVGLAAAAARVVAVEIDARLLAVLEEATEGAGNVEIVHGDALAMDLAALDVTSAVGNLPYGSAAQIVLRVLQDAARIERLTVMTQREVGERLTAPPGSRIYGLTSVLVAYFGRARIAAHVSRRAFFPVPNVDSVVVRIERRPSPDVDRDRLFAVARAAFAQRRKTLRRALESVVDEDAIRRAAVDPSQRAEQLGLPEFVALARQT